MINKNSAIRNDCGHVRLLCGVVLFALTASPAQSLNCDDYRDIGDQLRYILPLSTYALALGYKDSQGAIQATKTLAYTAAASGIFKTIGDKHRPDAGTSNQSFVSGHVSAAMGSAAFIYTRYGKGWGVPAYLLAGLTAYSRGCAEKHFDDDILGGTMVGLMSNWYATSPYPEHARLYPSFTSNELKIDWSILFGGNRQPRDPVNFQARYSFQFEFGPLKQQGNIVQSPNETGSVIDLAALEHKTTPTARLLFTYYPSSQPRQDWSIYYSPLGITEFGNPTEVFTFAGTVFDPADNPEFNTNYRWSDFRIRWRTAVLQHERWTLRLGAGVGYGYTKVDIEQGLRDDVLKRAEVSTTDVSPLIHASVDLRLSPRWSVASQIDGMSDFWSSSSEYYWNGGLFVMFKASPLWNLGFGARWITGKHNNSELFNEIETTDLTILLGRAF
jgi:hypothetical protein